MGNSSRTIMGTPTATAVASYLDSELLAAGEILPRRDRINSISVADVSGAVMVNYFTAQRSETITTLTAYTGSTAAGATPTLARMGVYQADTSSNLTLITATPNDTTLFAATNTAYPKSLSATWNKQAGQRYALAILVVTAAAMPTFHGLLLAGTNVMAALNRVDPFRAGHLAGQTDLPASITAASLTNLSHTPAIRMS